MSLREFTITELKRGGDGGYVDTPVKFTWTNSGMSAPRGSWKFGAAQRSVRTEYPGAEEPVEQVLGPNFKDFTLQGWWDDRYNQDTYPGGGFALNTFRQFEALTLRGSTCRFEFESISFIGLIKDADFDYKRASLIGYSFTVSPHKRQGAITSSTGTTSRRMTPQAYRPVTEYRDVAIAAADFMDQVYSITKDQLLASKMPNTAVRDTGDILDRIHQGVADLSSAIEQRVGAGSDTLLDLKRVSSTLNTIKGEAAAMLTTVAGFKSSVSLGYDNAVDSLNFDCWRTGLSTYARKLALLGVQGRDETARRANPKGVALYRPRKDESLYSISQRFYGTPTAWQLIASRNGLTTITLQGTEVLIIPERR